MNDVQTQLDDVRRDYGPWTAHNIRLTDGFYTLGSQYPEIDSLRGDYFVELAINSLGRPPTDLRVLDLGCLEGAIAIQFARAGACVDGVDIRPASIAKATFAKNVLGLKKLRFFVGDALNLSGIELLEASYDVIICAGLLYHIDAKNVLPLLKELRKRSGALTILDTHYAANAPDVFKCETGQTFHGRYIRELATDDISESKNAMWAGFQNERSFWLSEISLINALGLSGFNLVARVGWPNFVWPWKDRDTWIAFSRPNSRFYTQKRLLNEPDERASVHPTALAGYNWAIDPMTASPGHQASVSISSSAHTHEVLRSFVKKLANSGAGHVRFRMWWRDDDAYSDSPELRRLLSPSRKVPVTLAVVPGLLDSSLVSLINGAENVSIVQHGWKHINWAPDGLRPSEFPETRTMSEIRKELQMGFQLLESTFGFKFKHVFVPPWHNCARWILDARTDLNYRAVSREAPIFPLHGCGSDEEVNVEIDTADWTKGGAFIGCHKLAKKLIRAFDIRLKWNAESEPIGLLTHHASMTSSDCDELIEIVQILEELGIVEWIGIESVIE